MDILIDGVSYRSVPGFSRYAISECGNLINIETKKLKKWGITKNSRRGSTEGYYYSRVITDKGKSIIGLRHRMLLLAYRPIPNAESMTGNHLNGIPGDDRLSNLEWATRRENNQHAYENDLRPNAALAILVKDLGSGEISRYPTVSACARAHGHARGDYILWRIRKQPNRVYPDLLLFRFEADCTWPEITAEEIEVHRGGASQDMVARNVFDGSITIFNGCSAGEIATGVKAASILLHARTNRDVPIAGFNFRYLKGGTDFPEFSDKHLAIFKDNPLRPGAGVDVIDVVTNDKMFFTSVEKCGAYFNVGKTTISACCGKGKLFNGRYQMSYYHLN